MQDTGPSKQPDQADQRLHAVIGAAITSYLLEETPSAAMGGIRWALAARPDERGAGQPWPIGKVRWAQAERPR